MIYSKMGRPFIPPKHLLKAQLLLVLYSVRSDRMFCEMLNYNILFRWFLDMNLEELSFFATTFTKNRERLLSMPLPRRADIPPSSCSKKVSLYVLLRKDSHLFYMVPIGMAKNNTIIHVDSERHVQIGWQVFFDQIYLPLNIAHFFQTLMLLIYCALYVITFHSAALGICDQHNIQPFY